MSDASLQGKQHACQKQLNYYRTASEEDRLQQMRGKTACWRKKTQNRQKKNETAKVTFSVHVNLLSVPIIKFFFLIQNHLCYTCVLFGIQYLYFFCQFLLDLFICIYNGLQVMFFYYYYAFSWLCFFSPYVIYSWAVASSLSHPWLFVHVWIAVIPNFCMLT